MGDDEPLVCSFRDAAGACSRKASWVIAVGADLELATCDEHRNDVLMRYETKDVCGIMPLGRGD